MNINGVQNSSFNGKLYVAGRLSDAYNTMTRENVDPEKLLDKNGRHVIEVCEDGLGIGIDTDSIIGINLNSIIVQDCFGLNKAFIDIAQYHNLPYEQLLSAYTAASQNDKVSVSAIKNLFV